MSDSKRAALFYGAASLVALAVSAQLPPAATPGLKADGAYDFKGIDNVSLMNGGLSLQIPIAGPYAVNGGLSWSLALGYSNQAWEAYPLSGDGVVYPKPDRKAGLGWKLSLGELRKPQSGPTSYSPRWIYSDPAGGEHVLYPTLHIGETQDPDPPVSTALLELVNYTRDNSFLRVTCLTPSSFGDCRVEFPNGDEHLFHNFSAIPGSPEYRLTEIKDQFNNKVSVAYNSGNTLWTISQTGSSRVVRVGFWDPGSSYPDQRRLLQYVEVPCFQNLCDGGPATTAQITFTQELASIWRPAIFNASYTSPAPTWVLTEINLPNGTSYSTAGADYASNPTGEIAWLGLPSAGWIEWDWSFTEFPAMQTTAPCPQQFPPDSNFWTSVFGVTERREFDPNIDPIPGGPIDPTGTWVYERTFTTSVPRGTAQSLKVTLLTPLLDKSEHFFTVYPVENGAQNCGLLYDPPAWGSNIGEFGLPYSREFSDPLVADGISRFLSSKIYDCDSNGINCVAKRNIYQAWEHDGGSLAWGNGSLVDRNRRMRSERVEYLDDAPIGNAPARATTTVSGTTARRRAIPIFRRRQREWRRRASIQIA